MCSTEPISLDRRQLGVANRKVLSPTLQSTCLSLGLMEGQLYFLTSFPEIQKSNPARGKFALLRIIGESKQVPLATCICLCRIPAIKRDTWILQPDRSTCAHLLCGVACVAHVLSSFPRQVSRSKSCSDSIAAFRSHNETNAR